MPSLSTSLCIVSGPGTLPLLRNLTNLVFGRQHPPQAHARCPLQICSHLRRIKIPMVILDEFIDLMEVIRIKMIAFYAEMPFDRFGKELRFVGVGLADFVCVAQSWIIALTLWLKEVLDFAPRLVGIGL